MKARKSMFSWLRRFWDLPSKTPTCEEELQDLRALILAANVKIGYLLQKQNSRGVQDIREILDRVNLKLRLLQGATEAEKSIRQAHRILQMLEHP